MEDPIVVRGGIRTAHPIGRAAVARRSIRQPGHAVHAGHGPVVPNRRNAIHHLLRSGVELRTRTDARGAVPIGEGRFGPERSQRGITLLGRKDVGGGDR